MEVAFLAGVIVGAALTLPVTLWRLRERQVRNLARILKLADDLRQFDGF